MTEPAPIRVLMVCLGNICRSTMAESTLRHLVAEAGLARAIEVDSAGTGSWHIGSAPHPETQAQLRSNGIDVGDGRARQVTASDLEEFDYVVAMDAENLADLESLAARTFESGELEPHAELSLLLQHATRREVRQVHEVPDPYLVGGYDRVFELVNDGCAGLLAHLVEREGLTPRA